MSVLPMSPACYNHGRARSFPGKGDGFQQLPCFYCSFSIRLTLKQEMKFLVFLLE